MREIRTSAAASTAAWLDIDNSNGRSAAVLAPELIDPAAGIENLLLAGVERMAGGADFNVQFAAQRGSGRELVSATANDLYVAVLGMDSLFHLRTLFRNKAGLQTRINLEI
jgi:hypothetical protein